MIDRACISINSICNLDCPYCHFGNKKNNMNSAIYQFMPNEIDILLSNINQYIMKNNIKKFKLGIVGSGEPMLSFDIIKRIVNRVKQSECSESFKLYTITNGTLMNNEYLSFFYENKDLIDLNFSLDGHEKIHNHNRMNFNLTMKNINAYEQLFGYKPIINTVVTRDTLNNVEEILQFFLKNKFTQVNFSIVFNVNDPLVQITDDEYQTFLSKAKEYGIISRQADESIKRYDCTKYGKLCGVGRTNVFITRQGIYPCARFMENPLYKLSNYDVDFDELQTKVKSLLPVNDGQCYYEFHKVGE